jgi:hypothetical protein
VLTDVEDHNTHKTEVDKKRGWALDRLSAQIRITLFPITYTFAEGTARTDEETSTDGTTDGDHVKMARLHRLVENNETAVRRLGTALEGLEVETIAGHEVLTVAPFGLGARLLSASLDGRVWDAGFLIRREYLFVVHGGLSDSDLLVKERRIKVQLSLGAASFNADNGSAGGEQLTFIHSALVMARGATDKDPRQLVHAMHEPTAWHPALMVKDEAAR